MALKDAPLQSLIWPEPGLNTERDLYVRLDQGAALSMPNREIRFVSGGLADFGTAMNLFNVGKWHKYCGLEDLSLELEGEGTFELVVFHAYPQHSRTRMINDVIRLEAGQPQSFALRQPGGFENRGVVFFQLKALGPGALRAAQWRTEQAPRRSPQIMLSITTFRREAAVQNTVARFEAFMSRSALKDHLHLVVVDNGQSAEIAPSAHVTPIANENLGGSGGFARGLLAAQARGASHCLFMDDDAAVHMQAIERSCMFLAHALDENVAVCGALANAQHRWQMWENGARFHYLCHPQFKGLDLRERQDVTDMEFASTADKPADYYGGWWYFAFPVNRVRHMPFPFFVRGDDISFSLMNGFRTVPLPGVICFQDEDFSSKESPQTLYLDLRSHLANHLVPPQLEVGRKGVIKIAAWFFVRSFLSCHYETLSAVTLSLRDAIAGPGFFRENADMSRRRAEIKELMELEVWRPLEGEPPAERRRFDPDRRLDRALMKITLNGHLLPFFSRFGNHITLPAEARGARRPIWGAARITYVSADGRKAYTVQHDKRRAWGAAWSYLKLLRQLWRDYDAIRDRWREGYEQLTTRDFWKDRLNVPAQDRAATAIAAPADT
ncbi:glycosyltransferase [Lutimaribacter sp. EGI FJ00015]|uniref:Glycosyltransferase n=1 Tax=Lutimaribacter degradans TaxID=2945989 RepID=A0ACC6A1J5_9RHOB|nr:glycosyltransferase [Lutimaribacter sp. EGI FJ00013]MCM2563871.1 glycosyltransferase [Lutimaribacter sp. EGI FJ00013]MCO0615057.1 glycosyltransferase [Lutimaribacter sp. EGI FJ00015]MCO0637702.1 glycosyltransferase [Lutimaribacter sp. EGI FJ00014]